MPSVSLAVRRAARWLLPDGVMSITLPMQSSTSSSTPSFAAGRRRRLATLSWAALLLVAGCAAGEIYEPDTDYGMDGPLSPVPPAGKEDSPARRGLRVATHTRGTQVWSAINKWEDTDTAAARAPGMAWPRDSGLNWDEKYARWIESMAREQETNTFELTTPFGVHLPAPSLECAELSMFLRISFAAWYQLPFFMEAVDGQGQRVYFGHNGVRTAAGRYARTPRYSVRYRDFSPEVPSPYEGTWPRDPVLRNRRLAGGVDAQPMLGGEPFGAYVDEVHLNKRAGHFIMLALNYLGSIHLADSANTYNIVPEAVRAGDSLVERWQRRGIGHTLVVKEVVQTGEGNLDAALVFGSMPRQQPYWIDGVRSKQYFTAEATGGEGTNPDGDAYAALGGGLKRWRVTKNIGGYWSNTWMRSDEAHWIRSTDHQRISARPARFETLLGEVSPEDTRDGLLAAIADARTHLTNYPASCAARERREAAFDDLYDLMDRSFGVSAADVDRRYRTADDYIFAALEYGRSKTCCWNSTTHPMYRLITKYAADEQERAGACVAPSVFMHHRDGYRRWSEFASSIGSGALWRPWSADETCPQANVSQDVPGASPALDYCSWSATREGGGGQVPLSSGVLRVEPSGQVAAME